jgi:hypothetical protein
VCQWEQRNTRYPICIGNIELTNYIQSLNDGVLQEMHIIRDFVYDPEFCQTKCFGNDQYPMLGDFCVTSQKSFTYGITFINLITFYVYAHFIFSICIPSLFC